MATPSLPRFYSVRDVALATGLPASTIRGLISKGELPVFRPPKTRIVRIAEPDFLALVEKYTTSLRVS